MWFLSCSCPTFTCTDPVPSLVNSIAKRVIKIIIRWRKEQKGETEKDAAFVRWERDYELIPLSDHGLFFEYLELGEAMNVLVHVHVVWVGGECPHKQRLRIDCSVFCIVVIRNFFVDCNARSDFGHFVGLFYGHVPLFAFPWLHMVVFYPLTPPNLLLPCTSDPVRLCHHLCGCVPTGPFLCLGQQRH